MRPVTYLTTVCLYLLQTLTTSAQTVAESNSKLPTTNQSLKVDGLTGALIVDATETIGHFSLHRRYNSRSLSRGYFGASWCTDLDAKLQILSSTSIEFFNCGGQPLKLTYNKNHSRFENAATPTVWVDRRGIRGYRLFNRSHPTDFDTIGHIIQTPDHTTISYPDANTIELRTPNNSNPNTDSDSVTQAALILTVENGHVVTASLTRSQKLRYEYSGGCLIKALNTTYQYDELSNLTETQTTKISYADDLVTKVETKNQCAQTISYTHHPETQINGVTISQTCKNQPPTHQTYQYHYHIEANDQHVIDKIKTEGDQT